MSKRGSKAPIAPRRRTAAPSGPAQVRGTPLPRVVQRFFTAERARFEHEIRRRAPNSTRRSRLTASVVVECTEDVFVSGRCVYLPDMRSDRPDVRPCMHWHASHAYIATSASCSHVRRSGGCWALCVVAWAAEHAAAWFGSGSNWMQLVSCGDGRCVARRPRPISTSLTAVQPRCERSVFASFLSPTGSASAAPKPLGWPRHPLWPAPWRQGARRSDLRSVYGPTISLAF